MSGRRESVGPVATIVFCLCILAVLFGAAAGWLVSGAITAAPAVAAACSVAVIAAAVAMLRRLGAFTIVVRLPAWLARVESAARPDPRLSAAVQRAIDLAADEARHFRRQHIGTEHLLLGLMRANGHATRALASRGVTLEVLIHAVDAAAGPGSEMPDGTPILAPAARRVIDAATNHARDANARIVTSGEVLVALAMGIHGTAAAVIESLGCTPASLTDALRATRQVGED